MVVLYETGMTNFCWLEQNGEDGRYQGGQVEEGEDVISALKREVLEETNVHIEIKKMSAIYSSISEPPKVILDFFSEYRGGDIKADNEILDVGWFSREEILASVESDIMKYRIRWLLENQNNIRHASYAKDPFRIISEVLFTEKTIATIALPTDSSGTQ